MTKAVVHLLVALAILAPADERPDNTRTVYGWVADDLARPLSKVTPDVVEMFVDEQRTAVASVRARTSLSLIVLIDTSRSVRWDRDRLGEQLGAFGQALRPDDRLMLSTVGGQPFTAPFRSGSPDVTREVRRALDQGNDDGYGATPLWDALHGAVTALTREPPPRAVLLLSDGRSTGNHHGLVDIADYAMAHGVLVYVIARNSAQRIRQSPGTAVLVQPTAPIEAMAIYTGGSLFIYPEGQKEAAALLFSSLASQLSALHEFTFIPPIRDGQPHKLRLVPTHPGYRAHAPMAFVAPLG